MCGNLSFLPPCSDGSGVLPQQHRDRGPLSGAVGLALPTDLLWRPSSDGEVSIEVWSPVMAARGRVHWLAACFGHPAVILNSKWGGSLLEFRRGTFGSTRAAAVRGGAVGIIALVHAHLVDVLHVLFGQGFEGVLGTAVLDGFLGHGVEVGLVDAHLGQGGFQRQLVEEEVFEGLDALMRHFHLVAAVYAKDVLGKLHILIHRGVVQAVFHPSGGEDGQP